MLRAPRAPPGSFPFPARHSRSSRVKQHSLTLAGCGKQERGFQCLVKPRRGAQNTVPSCESNWGKIRGLRFRTKRLSKPGDPPWGPGCPGARVWSEPRGRSEPGLPQPPPFVRFRSVTRSRRGRSGHCGPTALPGAPRKPLGTAGCQHRFPLRQEPGRGRWSRVSPPRGHPRHAAPPEPGAVAAEEPELGARSSTQELGAARTARPEGRNPSEACAAAPQTPSFLAPRFPRVISRPAAPGSPAGFPNLPSRQRRSGPDPRQPPRAELPGAAPARSLPEVVHLAEDLLVLDVAAVLLAQRGAAHGALQAPDVPDEVVHLRQRRG